MPRAIMSYDEGQVTSNVTSAGQYYMIPYTYAVSTATTSIITVTSNQVWYNWVDQQLTAEELRSQARAAELKAQAKQAADARAKRLLESMLDDRQTAQYRKARSFEVLVPRTGETRRYLVEEGWAGNVYRVDDAGNKIERFCIHPEKVVPLADNMLAQKLLLEADERAFLRTANRSVPGRSPGVWVPAGRAA